MISTCTQGCPIIGEACLFSASGWLMVLHLAGLVFSLHALMRRHSPQGSLAWILGLNLLPLLCIPLYLALGAERIRRHTEERLPTNSVFAMLRGIRAHLCPDEPGSLGQSLTGITGMPACTGNRVHLLRDGNDTYEALAKAIQNAQSSILIEFFIIRNDRVGNNLLRLLVRKARAGVKVHVIFDEIGSHKLPRGYLRTLTDAGVRVASFNGRRFWWSSFLRINYRNHRKLVIIDSTLAYLGSLNVGLEYIRQQGKTYWRDTFAELCGPIVAQCLLSFAEDWQRATGVDISELAQQQKEAGEVTCRLIPSGPDDVPINAWELTLLEMTYRARRRLWLASPYFVPNAAVFAALTAAAIRGVDVRILVPSKGDSTMAHLALLSYLPELSNCGIQLLAYTPGFLHEKIALADESACCIGTANLDERSLRLNFELTLLMEGSDAAQRVCQLLTDDMKQARLLTPQHFHSVGFFTRMAAHICRLLAPIL